VTDRRTPRLRAVIVDDEPLSRRAMRQLLDAHGGVDIVAEHAAVLDLAAFTEQADVVFLDIEMPLRSGIDAASARARAGPPFVVFVTAHEEYGAAAFDADAADYLTKPVAPARLARALARVHERLQAPAALRVDGASEPHASSLAIAPPVLVARIGAREVIIPVAEVELFEADGVYAALHARGRRYLLRRALNDLERALGPTEFLRVHRSYLVRRSAIIEIRPGKDGAHRTLVLASGTIVPMSRRHHASVAHALVGR
jgi:two-component system, LytTR family, response regulator